MDIADRIGRLEQAIVAIVDLRDPANLQFPTFGAGERDRVMHQAELRLAAIANEIRTTHG